MRLDPFQYGQIGVKQARKARKRVADRMKKQRHIVAMIPARGGSRGIPLKNIAMVAGYPMLAHSILTLKVAGVDEIWVSTDNEKIKNVAATYGAKVLYRPKELAGDKSTAEEVIAHFLKHVPCDIVIMVQCTSPMLRPIEIRNGLDIFLSSSIYDSLFSAVVCHDMLLWDGEIKPINYDPRRRGRRQTRLGFALWESGGFYIFTRAIFERTGCRLGGNIGYSEVRFWKSFQVDNKEDLAMVRKLMERK